MVRQTLATARLFCEDEESQEAILRDVLQTLLRANRSESPPALARRIHAGIRERLENPDPYRDLKREFNQAALAILPDLRARMRESLTPFTTAVRVAIAGNLIDFGVNAELRAATLLTLLEHELQLPLRGEVAGLSERTKSASRILFLADNAGEIVLDRLLLEQLPARRTTIGVRGGPILNDVTADDVRDIGLPDGMEILATGSDAPGTILAQCSPAFVERFRQADLIIAKGQGNYETLSEEDAPLVFLLKVKCPVIARHIGHPVGSHVVDAARIAAPVVH